MRGIFGLVNPELTLTPKEKKELAKFNERTDAIIKERIEYLRGLARAQGITAATLAELKSASGLPFVEEKGSKGMGDFTIATVKESTLAGPLVIDMAYLCHSSYERKAETDTCGWVKGQPREEGFNNIRPLSGSAGTQYFCRICGKQIGEDVTIRSLR